MTYELRAALASTTRIIPRVVLWFYCVLGQNAEKPRHSNRYEFRGLWLGCAFWVSHQCRLLLLFLLH